MSLKCCLVHFITVPTTPCSSCTLRLSSWISTSQPTHPCPLQWVLEFAIARLPASPLQSYLYTVKWLVKGYQGQNSRMEIQKGVIWVGGENGSPPSLAQDLIQLEPTPETITIIPRRRNNPNQLHFSKLWWEIPLGSVLDLFFSWSPGPTHKTWFSRSSFPQITRKKIYWHILEFISYRTWVLHSPLLPLTNRVSTGGSHLVQSMSFFDLEMRTFFRAESAHTQDHGGISGPLYPLWGVPSYRGYSPPLKSHSSGQLVK